MSALRKMSVLPFGTPSLYIRYHIPTQHSTQSEDDKHRRKKKSTETLLWPFLRRPNITRGTRCAPIFRFSAYFIQRTCAYTYILYIERIATMIHQHIMYSRRRRVHTESEKYKISAQYRQYQQLQYISNIIYIININ